MVKMESLQPQLPSKFEFLEYLKFEYLEYKNDYWPTLLARYGYAPTLAGLETLLAESKDVFIRRNMICVRIFDENYYYGYEFCFESTLAELKSLAEYGYEPTLSDLETSPDLLRWFEQWFEREYGYRNNILEHQKFEDIFNGDWRLGQETHEVVITQRLYQTSPNSTQD